MRALCLYVISVLIIGASDVRASATDSIIVWIKIEESFLTEQADQASDRARMRRDGRGKISALPAVPTRVLDDLRQAGFRPRVTSSLAGAVSLMIVPEQLEFLRSRAYVRQIRQVRTHRSGRPPWIADPDPSPQPSKSISTSPDAGLSTDYLEMIKALDLIRLGYNGEGILLGFLDTEFGNFQHEVFQSHRSDGRIGGEMNFTVGPQSNRHGLMVASVAAGRTDGMMLGPAFGATLIGAVTEYSPTETRTEEENLVAGLEYLEAQGADIINISLGYIDFDDDPGYAISDLDGQTAITTIAVQKATELGVVMVVSAGNEGCTSPDMCWYYVSTPADAPGAITVGAVDERGNRAAFSSRGPTAGGRIKPDVAAPGVRVPVATGSDTYQLGSGTSFSAPLVAGVAAQLLQANPDLTPDDIQQILRSTARNAVSPDNDRGWGIIDAAAALNIALRIQQNETPPIATIHPPYPNPSAGTIHFDIGIPADGFHGSISLYDALGRLVMPVHNGTLSPGLHSFTIQPPEVASGIYFIMIQGDGTSQSGSIVILR